MSLTDPEKQWIAEWAGAIPDAIFPADLATRLPLFVLEFRQEFPGSQATDAEIEAAGAASVYGSRGAGLVPVEGGDDKRLAAMGTIPPPRTSRRTGGSCSWTSSPEKDNEEATWVRNGSTACRSTDAQILTVPRALCICPAAAYQTDRAELRGQRRRVSVRHAELCWTQRCGQVMPRD